MPPNLFLMISQIYPIEIDVKKISLLPLSVRREIHDLCLIFDCFHWKVHCNFSNFNNLVHTSTGRWSAQKGILLKIPCVKTKIFYNSYFNRIVKTWNNLPVSIRAPSKINIFKRKIKVFYFNKLETYDVNNQCYWSAACGCSKHH